MSGLVALVTIGLILSVLFIALVVFVVSLWTGTKFGPEYNWKPDLSSNVLDPTNLDPNLTNPWRFDQAITSVPKTEEQLHEERHAYLRERKSYD